MCFLYIKFENIKTINIYITKDNSIQKMGK